MKEYKNKKGKTLNCEVCNKPFYVSESRLLKNKHHTCSRSCSGKLSSNLHNKRIIKKCEVCGKDIFYKESKVKEIKHYTCSFECRGKLVKRVYKGDNNPKALKLNEFERFFWDKCINYKHRSEAKKYDFDLDYKFLENLYNQQKGCCYYTGIPMKLKGNKDFDMISLDRIDSSLGYTKDNVVFCLNCVNFLKSNYDLSKINRVLSANIPRSVVNLKIKKLYPDAKMPTKGNETDAGYDIYVHRFEDLGDYLIVYSGIAIQPEKGFYTELVSRSSVYKKGLILHNGIGIIDNSYTGEIISIFYKTKCFKGIEIGDRLSQLIPKKQYFFEPHEVEELSETERGSGGFGSTGVK